MHNVWIILLLLLSACLMDLLLWLGFGKVPPKDDVDKGS